MIDSAALRWLFAAKLRAAARKQLRALRRPRGAITAAVGTLLVGLWVTSILVSAGLRQVERAAVPDPVLVRGGCALFLLLALSGAFSHRGLYLPREEIERLFAAPLTRRQILRYRLVTSMGKSLLSGLVFGLLTMGRMPRPLFCGLGVVAGIITLPVIQQAGSLLLGSLENRFLRLLRTRYLRWFQILLAVGMGGTVLVLVLGDDLAEDWPALENIAAVLAGAGRSAAVRALLLPVEPWARAISATDWAEFLPAFAACLGVLLVAFELTSRLPVDFRELSLDTSADVAKRIRRMARGGFGASASEARLSTFSRRVPWIFGRSPFGAVAWAKLSAILRKARGTIVFSGSVLAGLTLLTAGASRSEAGRWSAPGLLIVVGILYLGYGLRFDFKADLDRLEAMKGWPLSPRRIFAANLLPQVALVSTLLTAAVLLQGAIAGRLDPFSLAVCALIPALAFAWMGFDNAVFLFAPQRTVAGQEGFLQHIGRALLLFVLRITLVGASVAAAAPIAAAVFFAARTLGAGVDAAALLAIAAVLLVLDVLFLVCGGSALRRLDVSRIPR